MTGTFSSAKATWLGPTTSVAAIATEQIIADFITSSLVDCSAYVEPKLKQLLLYVVRWNLLAQEPNFRPPMPPSTPSLPSDRACRTLREPSVKPEPTVRTLAAPC